MKGNEEIEAFLGTANDKHDTHIFFFFLHLVLTRLFLFFALMLFLLFGHFFGIVCFGLGNYGFA